MVNSDDGPTQWHVDVSLLFNHSFCFQSAAIYPGIGTRYGRREGHAYVFAKLTGYVECAPVGNTRWAWLVFWPSTAFTTGRLGKGYPLTADGTGCGGLKPLLFQGLA